MKKIGSILILIIAFFIIYFLQANFFSWFTIAGIKPNLFILLVLFIGLNVGKIVGAGFGFVFGFILDLLISKNIGVTGIALGLIGILGGYFNKNFSKDSRLTTIVMVIGSTVMFEVLVYVFQIAQKGLQPEVISFVKILSIEVLYNILLSILLYPIIQKLGYKIEGIFKEKKMLTRYF